MAQDETNDLAEIAETPIDDEADDNDEVPQVSYEISAYGADYDVDGLVKRLEKGDIFVPSFQRSYVWTLPQASQFIESLLLGLPVPGIFLAREEATNRMQVLDGQQRLKTLLFFQKGSFNPTPDGKYQRLFSLTGVQKSLLGRTYETLEDRDRRRLDDSPIHATIVKQDSPTHDDTSIYHIFKRLNSGSTTLRPQEIRCAVYHGPFIDELKNLNDDNKWRTIYGSKNRRLKDEELILRFLALYYEADTYTRPMAEFLNKFTSRHRRPDQDFLDQCNKLFSSTIAVACEAFGAKAFRRERAFNAAIYDSVMVGLAKRLEQSKNPPACASLSEAYDRLLLDENFTKSTISGTADEATVALRLKKAAEYFA